MEVKEYNTPDGDYIIEIRLSAKAGDRARMMERNQSHTDVPCLIAYNMGVDFPLRTWEGKKERLLGMLKMLRVLSNEAMANMGEFMGAKPPGPTRTTLKT